MHNSTPYTSSLTLWEAHKPVFHGICLRQVALFSCERKALCSKLEANFNACYVAFQNDPSPTLKLNLDKVRLELERIKLFNDPITIATLNRINRTL